MYVVYARPCMCYGLHGFYPHYLVVWLFFLAYGHFSYGCRPTMYVQYELQR